MILRKYEEIMDQIVVTDEMRERILQNIGRQSRHSHTSRFNKNQLYILAAAAVLLLVCGVTFGVDRGNRTASEQMPETELARSMDSEAIAESTEDTTATVTADAATGTDNAKVTADAADSVEESSVTAEADDSTAGSAADEALSASSYYAQEYPSAQTLSWAIAFPVSDIETLPFRVRQTTYMDICGMAEITYTGKEEGEEVSYRKSIGTEDNSGDYNTYAVVIDGAIGDNPLTIKGDGTLVYLAVWTDGTYSYSIYVPNGCSEEAMQTMIDESAQ